MVQTKTSYLGKVSYAIILLGWRYFTEGGAKYLMTDVTPTIIMELQEYTNVKLIQQKFLSENATDLQEDYNVNIQCFLTWLAKSVQKDVRMVA